MMSITRVLLLRLSGWVLLLTLPLLSGCWIQKTVRPIPEDLEKVCRCTSGQGQRHLYVFMLDGMDVVDLSGMHELKNYLHSLGVAKIWLGHSLHEGKLTDTIHQIHLNDPLAKFVLIAHRHGAESARDLAKNLGVTGVAFELLVYLGAPQVDNDSGYRPENVMTVLHVRGGKQLRKGQPLSQAENYRLMDADASEVPTHPEVVERLVFELARVAGSIEVPVYLPRLHELREGPTPFPVDSPVQETTPDEWDFLKPSLDSLPVGPPPSKEQGE